MEPQLTSPAGKRQAEGEADGDYSWLGPLDLDLAGGGDAQPGLDDPLPDFPALQLGSPLGSPAAGPRSSRAGAYPGASSLWAGQELGNGVSGGSEEQSWGAAAAQPRSWGQSQGGAVGGAEAGGEEAAAAEAGQAGGHRGSGPDLDLGGLDDDPIAYLEAAIEADRPRAAAPSAELQAVLEAVAAEAALPAFAQLMQPAPAAATASATGAGTQGAVDQAGASDTRSDTLAAQGLGQPTVGPGAAVVNAGAAHGHGAAPATGAAAAAGPLSDRRSPDIVLRGPGSSGGTSPGEPAQQLLLGQPAQHAEPAEPPLWTLLEEPEGEGEAVEGYMGEGMVGMEQEAYEEGSLFSFDLPPRPAAGGRGPLELHTATTATRSATRLATTPSPAVVTTANRPEPEAHTDSEEGSPSAHAATAPSSPLSHNSIVSEGTTQTLLATSSGATSNPSLSNSGSESGHSDEEATAGEDGSEESADRQRRQAFTLLQPLCSVLLQQRRNPRELAEMLAGLEVLVGELDPRGLAACLDYLLFPLLLAADSVAATRSAPTATDPGVARDAAAVPAMGNDKAAEAALSCLAAALGRCGGCQSGEQLLGMLQRLTPVLALGPSRACEEVRLRALLAVEAALGAPGPSGAAAAAHAVLRAEDAAPLLGHTASLLLQAADGELGPGQAGSRAVRVAALRALRCLLQAVGSAQALAFFVPGIVTGLGKALAAAGSAGGPRAVSGAAASSAAAIEALGALQEILVLTLGDGTVQPAQEHSKGLPRSLDGMASSQGGALEDLGNWAPAHAGNGCDGAVDAGRLDAAAALEQLRQLSQRAARRSSAAPASDPSATASDREVDCGSVDSSGTAASTSQGKDPASRQQPQQAPQGLLQGRQAAAAGSQGGAPRLRVDLDWGWVEGTAARVHEVLRVALPPLCAHPKPAVRQQLAGTCSLLLSRCLLALPPPTAQLLSEALFSLAQDEWPEVAQAARGALQGAGPLGAPGAGAGRGALHGGTGAEGPVLAPAALEHSLLRLAEGLPGALRAGSQQGIIHARKLTTCIQMCPPAWFAAHVLGQPSHLATLFSALVEAFEFDAASAALLAQAPPEAGAAYQSGKPLLPTPAAQLLAPTPHQRQRLAHGANAGPAGEKTVPMWEAVGHAACSADKAAAVAAAAARQDNPVPPATVLLPRMPLGLALLQTSAAYLAVAAACRAAGAAAAAAAADSDQPATGGGAALLRLADFGIGQLQQLLEEQGAQQGRSGTYSRRAQRPLGPTNDPQLAAVSQSEDGNDGLALQCLQDQPWQLRAAALVVVLTEMVFGASPAGQAGDTRSPPAAATAAAVLAGSSGTGADANGAAAGAATGEPLKSAQHTHTPLAASPELQSVVVSLVDTLLAEALWGLPTWHDAASGAPALPADPAKAAQHHPLTAQQLGVNVLATRVVVEGVGAAARALGPAFARTGRPLRAALLPLLERLGDPAPLVASAAGATLGSICLHCGYGTLSRLVGENADYVVDGVCAQLRQLERHPRAPQLLAVLMHKAGVAPELLPLLAEPARAAVQGVSILARRKRPEHVLAFLLALREIMQGAGACAEAALRDASDLAADVQARWKARRAAWEQAQAAATAPEGASGAGYEAGRAAGEGAGSPAVEEVREFFLGRQRERAEAAAAGGLDPEEGCGDWAGGPQSAPGKVELSEEQRALRLLRKRRVHAAASLAQTAVDCCGPLAVSSSLQVAVQALSVCTAGLRCLRATTLALELDEYQVEPVVAKAADVAPPDPLTPKLLPSVHLLWMPLMGALKDWRVSLLEAALAALADLASVAGSFLARRFGQEAWPALQRLLREGPPGKHIIAPGQDDLTSPASVQRVRCSVLCCLRSMAADPGASGPAVAGSSGGGAEVVGPTAGAVLPVVGEWMGDKQPAVLREQATQAFMALAKLDSDAAWTLLTTALRAQPGPTTLAAAATAAARGGVGAQPRCLADPGLFPSLEELCPVPPAASRVVPAGLRDCSAAKLAAMLAHVEKMGARWHQQVLGKGSSE